MNKPTCDVVFVNRSFWPHSPVVGEYLFALAEKMSRESSIAIIAQTSSDFKHQLKKNNRGEHILFNCMKRLTTSKSHLIWRLIESILFMLFVFWRLVYLRPKLIYVGTDPPVAVPFIAGIFKVIFGAKLIYHVQDIHPEATNAVFRVNYVIFNLAKILDNFTLRRSDHIITLSQSMASVLTDRTSLSAPISVLNNPGIITTYIDQSRPQIEGIAFCGNAGRLQLIPLLVKAIDTYLGGGGKLEFSFAGSGIYAETLHILAQKFPQKVTFHGVVNNQVAAELINAYKWALLPINDTVTQFAFPSKASTYVHSRANVLAICSTDTAVAQWVNAHKLGITVPPTLDNIVNILFAIEKGRIQENCLGNVARKKLREQLSFEYFIKQLEKILKQV